MGYSLCKMAEFQNGLISSKFGVCSSGFLHRTPLMGLQNCRIDFCMMFGILIFDPNRRICIGYSLSKMADFQIGLISGIFGVFSSGFLHRTPLMGLQNRFLHVFWNFKVRPKPTILHGLQPLQNGRFSKWSHFWNIWCFFERFFTQNSFNGVVESISACFLEF